MRRIEFEDVWDRYSCKIYSSKAEQSNSRYVRRVTGTTYFPLSLNSESAISETNDHL